MKAITEEHKIKIVRMKESRHYKNTISKDGLSNTNSLKDNLSKIG